MTRGIRGFIGLKKQLKLVDHELSGSLNLNSFQQAWEDLKIANVQQSDLKMVFGIYDQKRIGLIDYEALFTDLVEELPLSRKKVVREAFNHVAQNGHLTLTDMKENYYANRHPDVQRGVKTADEARFEFQSQFTSLHSARKGFRDDQTVTYEDFEEWHAIANTQIEKDTEFRKMVQ